jgi:hypothetical protein
MAVLGSTVDPRLGAVSPAAIQALSQAGAATGQMYANIGSSIAGVVQDYKSKKDDEALQQAYLDSLKIDDDGNQKVDRKAFLEAAKEGKVPSKLANAYLKNQLEISAMQNDMDIQDKMAKLEERKVGLSEDAEKRMGEQFAAELGLKTEEQELRVSQWATQNLIKMQELNALREAKQINKEQYDRDYALAIQRANNELKKLDISKDLTQAQRGLLEAETLFKKAETSLIQDERNSFEDLGIGVADEETYNNKMVSVLGIGDRITQWDPLNALEKADILNKILEGARKSPKLNMNTQQMVDLQQAYDFFNADDHVKGAFKRLTGTQQPALQPGEATATNINRAIGLAPYSN